MQTNVTVLDEVFCAYDKEKNASSEANMQGGNGSTWYDYTIITERRKLMQNEPTITVNGQALETTFSREVHIDDDVNSRIVNTSIQLEDSVQISRGDLESKVKVGNNI